MTVCGLQLANWNGNGATRKGAGLFEETIWGWDIILSTETHQSKESTLSLVKGYRWESTCFPEAPRPGSTRGSEEIAILYVTRSPSAINEAALSVMT
jgi:hypothetical protein